MRALSSALFAVLFSFIAGLFARAQQTPTPTPAPTVQFSDVLGATTVLSTQHRGSKCSTEVVGWTLKSYQLGKCSQRSSLSCRVGHTRDSTASYSIRQDYFFDAGCSDYNASKVLFHDRVCTGNRVPGLVGGSSSARCLSDLHYELSNRDQVLVQSFLDPKCSGKNWKTDGSNPEIVSLLLGQCAPVMTKAEHLVTDRHRMLTWVSGDGVTSDIVLTSVTYTAKDTTCARAPLKTETIVFTKAGGGTCLVDPLMSGRFYANVFRTPSIFANARPTWLNTIPLGGVPSIAPTPRPTYTPTSVPSYDPSYDPSLIWSYQFEEGDISGTSLLNKVAGGPAATLYGSPSVASDSPSTSGARGLVLDTASKYIKLPTLTASAYTYTFWVKIPPVNHFMAITNLLTANSWSSGTIISITSGQRCYIAGDSGKGNGGGDDSYGIATLLASNSWFHMGFAMGGTHPALYIDGVLAYTWDKMSTETTARTYTNNFFGNAPWTTGENLVGSVDDIRLYTRQLSAAEMLALASKTVGR